MSSLEPSSATWHSWRYLWWIVCLAAVSAYGLLFFNWTSPPAEDAAMLMRYAQNLGQGHGYVWNLGAEPVDGATDFLLTVLLGSLVGVGLEIATATRLVGLISHAATIVVLAVVFQRQKMPAWLSTSCLVFFAIGGGLVYAEAYFGTSFFALLGLLAWLAALRLRDHPESIPSAVSFGLASLTTGLARPEGVFLCFFMWLALLWWHRSDLAPLRSISLIYFAIMSVLGGGYFLWHWRYFGHPFPNPFYVKGGGSVYPSSLLISIASTAAMTLPFLLPLALSMRAPESRKKVVFLAIPTCGFAALWLLLTDEMNYFMRFQYCLVPIVLANWYPPFRLFLDWRGNLGSDKASGHRTTSRGLVRFAIAGVVVLSLGYQHLLFAGRAHRFGDGRQLVGRALRSLGDRGYFLATAEAGLLPFESRWAAIDLWGLNDKEIAHNGLNFDYLDEHEPAVFMYHAHKSPVEPVQKPSDKPYAARWAAMIDEIDRYLETRPYRLAAAFAVRPDDAHYYFVRQDLPDSAELFERIIETEYIWPETGEIASNLALGTRFLADPKPVPQNDSGD